MSLIRLRGASEHNLRSVDVDLPVGAWICVTGPSGSGKTSLVFDTLVREGQHRYLGALSPRARQFFGKLGRASLTSLEGMPPAVAIGQSDVRSSARSTVGTLTGVLDLLRLLYARVGQLPREEFPAAFSLTRSHFSFNNSEGACEACSGSGVSDQVSEDLIVADPSKSLRDGALVPTLKNGYTVYSQVTLEVMNTICEAHGFDVHRPWRDLTDEQRRVIMHGTKELEVPFGKHSIESRMKWEGITARPREVGFYKGLIPVIEETLKRNRNPNILRFVRSVDCEACGGSRLGAVGRKARVGDRRLPELLELPVRELPAVLAGLPASEVLEAMGPELERRLGRMEQLGLGHLTLDRSSASLSAGEAQRLRLATQLSADLSRLLIALDEPTLGLHPEGQAGMRAVLDDLRDQGNTLLVVEHDPDMVRHGDHWVAVGPGAGPEGGSIVHQGELPAHPLGMTPPAKAVTREARACLRLRGATMNNLKEAELEVRLGTFQVVCGPSGAGKTSLVFGTLLPALLGEAGGAFSEFEGQLEDRVRAIDARPIGKNSRSTPATWSGLMDLIRKAFAETPEARRRGLGVGHFSFNSKAKRAAQAMSRGDDAAGAGDSINGLSGRCESCEGLGYQRVGLHLLEDLELPCPDCHGKRYSEGVLAVELRGKNIAQVLELTVHEAREYFAEDAAALALCEAMDRLGLGYMPLGYSSKRLSRGEAQRVKLATLMGNSRAQPTLLALDEPDRGLHPQDVLRLLACIDDLVDAGHTVLAISHHRHLWAHADSRIEVRDGVARCAPPFDAEPLEPLDLPRSEPKSAALPEHIELRGVTTHNLRNIDVRIPHAKLTAICGVSGSGKSSLAFDTLASEAWQRFSESLPFQVRRFMKRMSRPELNAAAGLGPVLALRQGQARAGRRSTVATQSELGPLLRLLWSRTARIEGAPCGLAAEDFSPDRAGGACSACEGVGTVRHCDPKLLVSHPELSLAEGALGGTRVGQYLGEPEGQFLATLRAAGPQVDWDQPWECLPEAAQVLALDGGDGQSLRVRWALTSKKRGGEGKDAHEFEGTWDGLLALAEREALRRVNQKSALQWAEPLRDVPCETCKGTRLSERARRARVASMSFPEVMHFTLDQLLSQLRALQLDTQQQSVFDVLLPEVEARSRDLCALGLGHLALDRSSRSLSGGELQRLRLASVLRSGLAGLTLVLDEATSGLHARDVQALIELLRGFVDRGNTVIVVEHELSMLAAADHCIELGPGAGQEGGSLIAEGSLADLRAAETPTGLAFVSRAPLARARKNDRQHLLFRGCTANNLKGIDVELPTTGLVALTGVSGSGKSSLLFEVIEASVRAERPIQCESFESPADFPGFDQIRTTRWGAERGTVLGVLDLMPALQALFQGPGRERGLSRQAFSFASPAGRCPACLGRGRERVPMDFMADLDLACADCDGGRYRPEVLQVHWDGMNVAQLLELPVLQLMAQLPSRKWGPALEALEQVGLGHLSLGRRVEELSGGELQRLTLAASLASAKSPGLYLFDEPARGLHEADIEGLVEVFYRLTQRGDLVVIAEHRLSLIARADHVVDLGPESGPAGGHLVEVGAPAELEGGATAKALRTLLG